MIRTLLLAVLIAIAGTALSPAATAQGVDLERSAVVLSGSDANCSRPATIDFGKVRKATDQWKEIRRDGVRPGSARYQILINKMMQEIRAAADAASSQEGVDLVVREGDISDAKGLDVEDLTDEVISNLD